MILFQKTIVIAMSDSTFEERWKHIVFNKNITEEESLKFYETWAATVSTYIDQLLSIHICATLLNHKRWKCNEVMYQQQWPLCNLQEKTLSYHYLMIKINCKQSSH